MLILIKFSHLQELFAKTYLEAQSECGEPPTKEDVDQLLREARMFTLASHFFWALWSVVNGAVSTIPFDYWVS